MKFSKAMIDVMTAVFPHSGDSPEGTLRILRDYTYDIHKTDTRRLAAAIQLEELGFVRPLIDNGMFYTVVGYTPSQRS